MAHMDVDDTSHNEGCDSQATKTVEGVKKITDVINSQMLNPFHL